MKLVKAEYLYKYWRNKDIVNIENKENVIIVIKNNLIKKDQAK